MVRLLMLLSVFVVVVAAGAAYYVFLSHPIHSYENVVQKPIEVPNQSAPSQISTALSDVPNALPNLMQVTSESIANRSSLIVDYSGTIAVDAPGYIPLMSSFSAPLSMQILRSGNDRELNVTSSVPVLGSVSMRYITLSNSSYLCSNLNLTSVTNHAFTSLVTQRRSWNCMRTNSLFGVPLANVSVLDISALSYLGVVASYNGSYQSSLNGVPCTYVDGVLTLSGSNVPKGHFAECVSNSDYLPLQFGAYFYNSSSGKGASLVLNETSLSTGGTPPVITLPGPVTNG